MFQLILLKDLDEAERAVAIEAVAALEILPEQAAFVGVPSELVARGLAEPARKIFAIIDRVDGEGFRVVGTGTLHRGAAEQALNWSGDWVLLRAFLIGAQFQGRGYGSRAAAESALLAQELFADAEGVVLGVNEANVAGQRAYRKAGYDVVGGHLDQRAGRQFVMAKRFPSTLVDATPSVN